MMRSKLFGDVFKDFGRDGFGFAGVASRGREHERAHDEVENGFGGIAWLRVFEWGPGSVFRGPSCLDGL